MNDAKIYQMICDLQERLGFVNKKIRMEHEIHELARDIDTSRKQSIHKKRHPKTSNVHNHSVDIKKHYSISTNKFPSNLILINDQSDTNFDNNKN